MLLLSAHYLWSCHMDEKNTQNTSSDRPSSPDNLSESQRQVLAKVYRFLLGLKRNAAQEDADKEQSAYSEVLHPDSSPGASVKSLDR